MSAQCDREPSLIRKGLVMKPLPGLSRLAAQVELLAQKVDDLPLIVDDEWIVETLSDPVRMHSMVPEALQALFVRAAPALLASYRRGVDSFAFCSTRGVDVSPPVGEFDRLARTLGHFGRLGWPAWPDPPATDRSVPTEFDNEAPTAEAAAIHAMRSYLARLLVGHLIPAELLSARVRRSSTGLPVLTEEESGRLLRLVAPLQTTPDQDLPLLLWKDSASASIESSWPKDGHEGWTPFDVGLSASAHLLLARPDPKLDGPHDKPMTGENDGIERESGASTVGPGGRAVLKSRALVDWSPEMEDAEVIRILMAPVRLFGAGLEATQALYLAIETPLMASLLAGVATIRRGEDSGVGLSDRDGPVMDAASFLAYADTSAMPNDLASESWLMPGTEGYRYTSDLFVPRLHDDDDLRSLLVFYLLERHPIRDLRKHKFKVEDIPVLDNSESERLLSLVAPLEDQAGSDLPMLLWRDESGSIKTSHTGQNWTELDTVLA